MVLSASAAPFGLADHQRRHLLRADLFAARAYAASAARIPVDREQLGLQGYSVSSQFSHIIVDLFREQGYTLEG